MFLRRRARVKTETAPTRRPEPRTEVYVGTTITPDEGAKLRIDSAADIDPNVKAYGVGGVFRGGAGGYGGAGTK